MLLMRRGGARVAQFRTLCSAFEKAATGGAVRKYVHTTAAGKSGFGSPWALHGAVLGLTGAGGAALYTVQQNRLAHTEKRVDPPAAVVGEEREAEKEQSFTECMDELISAMQSLTDKLGSHIPDTVSIHRLLFWGLSKLSEKMEVEKESQLYDVRPVPQGDERVHLLSRFQYFGALSFAIYHAKCASTFIDHMATARPGANYEVVAGKFESANEKPAWAVLKDHHSKCVVLTIRGTASVHDLLTDIGLETEPFLNGYAHGGIARAAMHVVNAAQGPITQAMRECPDYKLVLTGHSLGAGTASLATLYMRKHGFPTARAVVFASPACISPNLMKAAESCIEGVVCNDDVIPRATVGGFLKLIERLHEVANTEEGKMLMGQRETLSQVLDTLQSNSYFRTAMISFLETEEVTLAALEQALQRRADDFTKARKEMEDTMAEAQRSITEAKQEIEKEMANITQQVGEISAETQQQIQSYGEWIVGGANQILGLVGLQVTPKAVEKSLGAVAGKSLEGTLDATSSNVMEHAMELGDEVRKELQNEVKKATNIDINVDSTEAKAHEERLIEAGTELAGAVKDLFGALVSGAMDGDDKAVGQAAAKVEATARSLASGVGVGVQWMIQVSQEEVAKREQSARQWADDVTAERAHAASWLESLKAETASKETKGEAGLEPVDPKKLDMRPLYTPPTVYYLFRRPRATSYDLAAESPAQFQDIMLSASFLEDHRMHSYMNALASALAEPVVEIK